MCHLQTSQSIHIHQHVPADDICLDAATSTQIKKTFGHTCLTARVKYVMYHPCDIVSKYLTRINWFLSAVSCIKV